MPAMMTDGYVRGRLLGHRVGAIRASKVIPAAASLFRNQTNGARRAHRPRPRPSRRCRGEKPRAGRRARASRGETARGHAAGMEVRALSRYDTRLSLCSSTPRRARCRASRPFAVLARRSRRVLPVDDRSLQFIPRRDGSPRLSRRPRRPTHRPSSLRPLRAARGHLQLAEPPRRGAGDRARRALPPSSSRSRASSSSARGSGARPSFSSRARDGGT